MSNHLPAKFHAFIGGYFGTDYIIELDGDELVYLADEMHSGEGRRERIKPTENEWDAFRMKLNELDVWKWKKKYWSEACDGTQWELEIKYRDKRIKSDGSNAYPDAPGNPDAGPEQSHLFDEYLKAIRTLIGGRDFC